MMNMNLRKIVIGALIYLIWSVLIGYFVIYLISWALVIAALVAGIYTGFRIKTSEALQNGFAAGFIGGIILGVVSLFVPSIYGIPLSIPIIGFLIPFNIPTTISWVVIPILSLVGAAFAMLGATLGSITKLRKLFLFLTLFTLFLFYAALDNVAWWWGRASWTWSISHVLTHWVDITVSLGFAFFVIILAHILKIY